MLGAYCGWKKAAKAREKYAALQQIEKLMARIQGEIYYRRTEMAELLEQLKKESFCSGIGLENCSELREYRLPNVLNKSEKEQLSGFFKQLGSVTSVENEQQGLYYQKVCAQLQEQAYREMCTAESLYTKLGLCAGVMIAVVTF